MSTHRIFGTLLTVLGRVDSYWLIHAVAVDVQCLTSTLLLSYVTSEILLSLLISSVVTRFTWGSDVGKNRHTENIRGP
jgi:hypothetical protein